MNAPSRPCPNSAHQRSRGACTTKTLFTLALLIISASCSANAHHASPTPAVQPGTSVSFGFDAATPSPPGSLFATPDAWVIRAESSAPSQPNALCRTNAAAREATLIFDTPAYADLTDSVSLEPLAMGENGLILRAQDERNFYLVAADAGTGRISIAFEKSGTRMVLASVVAMVQVSVWQELSAQIRGEEITAFLNGRKVASANAAWFSHGSIGLWSGPNASACFDNLMATGL